jgi:hypothetical protein
MSRYAIWNKKDAILTPIGEVITAEKWIERYPIAGLDSIKVVCAGGEINGAFFGTLGQMVEMYTKEGCDFSACETDQDKLDVIEAFEDARNTPSGEPTVEERQAAALEAIAIGATSESTAAMNALLTGEE